MSETLAFARKLRQLDRRQRRLARRYSLLEGNQGALLTRFVRSFPWREPLLPETELESSCQLLRQTLQVLLQESIDPFRKPLQLLQRLGARARRGQAGGYRRRALVPLCPEHEPTPPGEIQRLLERSAEWFSSQHYSQLHPVLQMALSQVRLLEISPFPENNQVLVLLFSCAFPLAAGQPLPLPGAWREPGFGSAFEAALHFETAPLLELNLAACNDACSALEALLGPEP